MASMSRGLNLPSIQRIMTEFEKESSMMDMKGDMMSDAIDDVMDDEEGRGGGGRRQDSQRSSGRDWGRLVPKGTFRDFDMWDGAHV